MFLKSYKIQFNNNGINIYHHDNNFYLDGGLL